MPIACAAKFATTRPISGSTDFVVLMDTTFSYANPECVCPHAKYVSFASRTTVVTPFPTMQEEGRQVNA